MSKKPKTFKNPRRQALAMLKDLRDSVSWLSNGWNVRSTAYDIVVRTYTDQRGVAQSYRDHEVRPRQYEEYPENDPANWSALYAEAGRMADRAQALREFAAQQYHAAVARNAAR